MVLTAVACLVEKTRTGRLCLFLYGFGIWDVFYYLWLKALLNWPATLLDWDVLFLIPLPWVAPILYPVLTSLIFITVALTANHLASRGRSITFALVDRLILSAAAILVVASFLWKSKSVMGHEVPRDFPWWLWGSGVAMGLGVFLVRILRSQGTGDKQISRSR